MIPSKIAKPVSFILIILYFASCTTTYEVTRRSELNIPDDLGEITVTTNDNKKYISERYLLKDSVLSLSGSIVNRDSEKPFSGKLNLSDIRKIEAKEGSLGKTVLIIGAGAAVIITFIAFLNKHDGMKNAIVVKYAGGNCNSLAGKYYPENTDKPTAAGLKDIINKTLTPSNSLLYLDLIDESGVYHFSVKNETDRIEFEMLNSTGVYSNAFVIDLRDKK